MSSLHLPSSTHIPPAPEHIVSLALTEDFKEAFLTVLNEQRIAPESRKIRRNYIYDPFLQVLKGEKISYKDYVILAFYSQEHDFISKIFDIIKDRKKIDRLDEYLAILADKKNLDIHFHKNLTALKIKFTLEGKIPDGNFTEIISIQGNKLISTIDDEGIEELSIIWQDWFVYSPVKVWKKWWRKWKPSDLFLQDIQNKTVWEWCIYWETPHWFVFYNLDDEISHTIGWYPIASFETQHNIFLVIEENKSIHIFSVQNQELILSIKFEGKLAPTIKNIFQFGDDILIQYSQDTKTSSVETLYHVSEKKKLMVINENEWQIEQVFWLFWKPVVLLRIMHKTYLWRPIQRWVLHLFDPSTDALIFPDTLNEDGKTSPYDVKAYEYWSHNPETWNWNSPLDIDELLSHVTYFKPARFANDARKPLDTHPDILRSLVAPFLIYDASGNVHHLMISQKKEDIYQKIIQNPSLLQSIFQTTWKKIALKNNVSHDGEAINYYLNAFDELLSGELSQEHTVALFRVFSDDEFLFQFIQSFVEYCSDSNDIEIRSMIEILDFSKIQEDRQKMYDMLIQLTHLASIKWIFARWEFFTQYQEIATTENQVMYIHKQWIGYAFQTKWEVYFDITFGPKGWAMKGQDSEKWPDEEGYFTVQMHEFFDVYEKTKDDSSPTGWKITKVETLKWKVDDIFWDDDIFIEYSIQTEKIVYSTSLKKTFFSMNIDEWIMIEMKKTSLGCIIMVSIPKQVLPSETHYSPWTWFTIVSDIGKTIWKFTMIDGFEREGQESIFIWKKNGSDEEYIIIDNLGNILFENVTKYKVTQDTTTGKISLEGWYIVQTNKGWSPRLFSLPLHISHEKKQ